MERQSTQVERTSRKRRRPFRDKQSDSSRVSLVNRAGTGLKADEAIENNNTRENSPAEKNLPRTASVKIAAD